jgi:chromosome segregation ATPase
MSSNAHTGSRRGVSRQFSKSSHERKTKEKKQKNAAKYLQEETHQATSQEIIDKTLTNLNRLGNQVFALSPFSQYYDDWLVNLRQTISEFESASTVAVDEFFTKQRTQAFLDVEAALAENRLQEANLSNEAKDLADINHQIVDADKQYAQATRELSNKRNNEVQRLSSKIRELENELKTVQQTKIGFFQFSEKRRTQEKHSQLNRDLSAAKNELEVTLQSFTAEQEKLHDNYEKQKQELSQKSDLLHDQVEKGETDTSTAARRIACNVLSEAVKAVIARTPQPQTDP